ncbi:MAG: 4Fe-4S dicluster domain-containing protein [Armatimonadetes bacterium]|nr:4Fe-4S dicluster domain-containing protein [Armatimonadota bacterium]
MDLSFKEEVKELSGANVDLCYQCQKCSNGCPLLYVMDFSPAQIIAGVRLGKKDLVFKQNTFWICINCKTCTARCPQGIEIAKIMDALRKIALKEKREIKEKQIYLFYRLALKNILSFGRLYELGLILDLKLKTKEFTKDLALGFEMFKKNKLSLFPKVVDRKKLNAAVNKIKKRGADIKPQSTQRE